MNPEGEEIIAYRAHRKTPEVGEEDLSFGEWTDQDELPPFQDHVEGFTLVQPQDDTGDATVPRDAEWPNHIPYHPSFGHKSGVKVPVPGEIMMEKESGRDYTVSELVEEKAPRRTGRDRGKDEANDSPTRWTKSSTNKAC